MQHEQERNISIPFLTERATTDCQLLIMILPTFASSLRQLLNLWQDDGAVHLPSYDSLSSLLLLLLLPQHHIRSHPVCTVASIGLRILAGRCGTLCPGDWLILPQCYCHLGPNREPCHFAGIFDKHPIYPKPHLFILLCIGSCGSGDLLLCWGCAFYDSNSISMIIENFNHLSQSFGGARRGLIYSMNYW